MIEEAISKGVDIRELINGTSPLVQLVAMYYRSPRFSSCVRVLQQSGADVLEPVVMAVLLDDETLLRNELRTDPSLIKHHIDLNCSFTPLRGATLLHLAAEFGHYNAARVLVEARANIEAKAAIDEDGLNGHTPIFHTVCQHNNHCRHVLQFLLKHGAKTEVQLKGITWGKGFPWATVIFDPTPISYAQSGLLPQFQRREADVYDNIRLLATAANRKLPEDLNVPNKYLHN